jgi:hypothetical protein
MEEIIANPDNVQEDKTTISWDGTKYAIIPGKSVEKIIPFPRAGILLCAGLEIMSD